MDLEACINVFLGAGINRIATFNQKPSNDGFAGYASHVPLATGRTVFFFSRVPAKTD